MLHSKVGTILLGLFHGFFEDCSGVSQSQSRYGRKFVWIHEVGLLGTLVSVFIVHFSVDTCLRLIFDPFSNEKLVLRVIEVTTLSFTLVANPVTLKMITVSLCQNAVTIAFSLVPLAFVDILVRVDHTTFSLR